MSDALRADELHLIGGSWAGLLFDNPSIGLEPQLSWTFTFDYREVSRDYGTVDPNLVVDWAPLPPCSWHDMTGQHTFGSAFAEPIESSVYFFEHHRFDRTELKVEAQRGDELQVSASVDGDIDGLGIPSVTAEGWLRFGGITVALSSLDSAVDRAHDRLADFTDASGLLGTWTGRNIHFVPNQ